jgi:hypothetical protein
MGNMDEDTKVNMMNMVGGIMGGGDLAGMLGGIMSGEGDLSSSLGPMMGMVTSMLNGGGDTSSTNLADMLANMTLPTVEEVPETTEEETPQ